MRYLGQRLLQFVLVFVVVTFTVMAATRIGLDGPRPRPRGRGRQRGADRSRSARTTRTSTSRCPCSTCYWLKDILTGDWGYSYVASQSTLEMFQQRMPTTVFIAFWAIVIGLLIAVPLGVYSAYKRDSRVRPGGEHRLVRASSRRRRS